MRYIIAVAALLLSATRAYAQDATEGHPSGGVSALLSVRSSAPVLPSKCRHWTKGCFRLFLQIRPKTLAEINIAAAVTPNGAYLIETTAYSSSGATCTGELVGGLPRGLSFLGGGYDWGNEGAPFVATADKPGTMVAEFSCDENLLPGDELTVQITLFVDPDGRGIKLARYVFPKMKARTHG